MTAHSVNDVPLTLAGLKDVRLRAGGTLGDIAPTMLQILGVPQPQAMTGKSLLI